LRAKLPHLAGANNDFAGSAKTTKLLSNAPRTAERAGAVGYDDTSGQSSYIVVTDPTDVTITLTGN